jgi:anaerobic magnesium-protoporphyrin IX monomethyl ester cyclase
MKIAIAYPPLDSKKGIPLLSQNRQFQYFNNPTFIYPVIPAYLATMLKKNKHDVIWLDGIAEQWSYQKFLEKVEEEKIDLIVIETKTPVIKQHWKIINDLKKNFPKLITVIVGDHVTAYPFESLENSKVDYVITGGDFDFAVVKLIDYLTKKTPLESGVYFRNNNDETVNTGKFQVNHPLDSLPIIDRKLTKWELYAFNNGNFKYTPGTYTMIGRDCWWRKPSVGGQGCVFCSWTSIFPNWRSGKPEKLLDEIGELIKLGVREVFDDTGTFPVGPWLNKFCNGMIERGYNKKVVIGCNMRANALNQAEYDLMGKANFRFILYGLESANQNTLDRLNKGTKTEDMVSAAKMATKSGLEPHVTCMVGYPWESYKEAQNTVARTKELFDKGWINTLQATIVIPYPGTALFKECEKNNWLKTKDWDRFDMREPIMKSPISDAKILELTQSIYTSFLTPKYLIRKLLSLRSWDDINYYILRGGKYILGHVKDFRKSKQL